VSPIGLRLREWRDALDWSQQELSDRSGVRQATISELESGKAQRADFMTLERLAFALDVEVRDLFERGPSTTGKAKKRR
jgi:putative transcriptional regulator